MTPADLARLELAKRAYAAVQPSESEVQTGVRRARLSLRRVKSRRSWFGKGLVLVVLAVGGLAYAKPHALGELVEGLSRAAGPAATRPGARAAGSPTAPQPRMPASEQIAIASPASAAAAVISDPKLTAAPKPAAPVDAKSHEEHRGQSPRPPLRGSRTAGAVAASSSSSPPASTAVSDWGRVAQALGRGDEAQALLALGELARSDDPRTRDKADLGRAQLFIARGDRDQGCALARSLSNRRAGSHIERQAQLLLKSCAP